MIIQKILFNLIAFTLFVIFFLKMIKKNDTTYIDILIMQFIGIAINFIELISGANPNLVLYIIIYSFSLIIPCIILFIETKKGFLFPEILNIAIAKFFIIKGDTETAKKYILNLIDKYPNSYLGHKQLAQIYEEQEKYTNAIDEYVRAIEINTKDYNSYYKIAGFLKELNKNEEAINMLNDLLKKKPDYLDASLLLGDILYMEERFKEATFVYSDALKYNPGNYEIYYNLGMVYTRLNDFQKAKEYYETAAEINSLLYSAKFSLAQIAMIYGDLEEAKRRFMECLTSENMESGAYYYLAQICMLKGEKEKAIDYINVAIELDSKIYKKIEGQAIFAPIIKKIRVPNLNDTLNITKSEKISIKEEKTQKHLEDTYYLVNKLNNNDLKMMKNMKNNQIENKKEDIKQKEKE